MGRTPIKKMGKEPAQKTYMKGTNVAISGDVFGSNREPAKIKAWLEIKGGKYAGMNVEPGVTHLVCSESHFKKNIKAVQVATKLKIPIVTWDWLEDSCQNGNKYKAGGKYLCKTACQLSAKERTARAKREREAMRKDGSLPPRDPDSALSMAAGFFDEHLANLESGTSKKTKPDVEEYGLYNNILKNQGIGTSGGGEGDCGDAEDEDTVMSDAKLSSPTPSMFSGTPCIEEYSSSASPVPSVSGAASAASSVVNPPSKPVLVSKEQLEGQSSNRKARSSSSSSSSSGSKSSDKLARTQAATAVRREDRAMEDSKKQPAPLPYPKSPPPIRPRRPAFDTDEDPDIENHHLYRDVTNFAYDIKLFRVELKTNTNDRYVLRIYESHTTPNTYAVHLRYFSSMKAISPFVKSTGLASTEGTTIVPVGSSFPDAFRVFQQKFLEISGVAWEERLDTLQASKIRPSVDDAEGVDERYFRYWAPKEGEPKGVFPPGFRPTVGAKSAAPKT